MTYRLVSWKNILLMGVSAVLFSGGTISNAMKQPSNPDSKGQFAQCMKQNAPAVCRDWALKKMGDYANALEYVRIHNKTLRTGPVTQRQPLSVDELSEKFEKWYQRFLALDNKSTQHLY